MSATVASGVYETDFDPFTEEVLADPYEHFAMLRNLGPVIYFNRYGFYGLFRYDLVKSELADWQTFSSAQGTALNPIANEAFKDLILSTDPPRHDTLRSVYDAALKPKFIRKVAGDIDSKAQQLVDDLIKRREFDGVVDFAQVLPVHIVLDLVGLPKGKGRDKVLDWAFDVTNFIGPPGARQEASIAAAEEQLNYLVTEAGPDRLAPGSFGESVYQSVARGEITNDEALRIMVGYVTAGLDTTVSAAASTLWMFATHPDQWQLVREDETLVPSAFLEAMRLESPAQYFSRVTTKDVHIEGCLIPEGSRIIHGYGAANRDERHYPDPDRFDVRRNPIDALTFSHGIHTCPGRTLASMEGHALFQALADRAAAIELAGEPSRRVNNVTRGLATLPVRITPA